MCESLRKCTVDLATEVRSKQKMMLNSIFITLIIIEIMMYIGFFNGK